MNVIFHVGLPKTGTTTFQCNILPILRDSGIIYFDPHYFDPLFKILESTECCNRAISDITSGIYDYIIQDNNRCLVISREQLASIHLERYERIWKNFERITEDIDHYVILIVARFQVDWLWSLYKHAVREGLSVSPERFFGFHNENVSNFTDKAGNPILYWRRDFIDLYEMCVDNYGKHRVRLLFFENFVENQRSFVSDFLKIPSIPAELHWHEKPQNIGLSEAALAMMVRYGFCGPSLYYRAHPLIHKFNRYYKTLIFKLADQIPSTIASRVRIPNCLQTTAFLNEVCERNSAFQARNPEIELPSIYTSALYPDVTAS